MDFEAVYDALLELECGLENLLSESTSRSEQRAFLVSALSFLVSVSEALECAEFSEPGLEGEGP